MQAFDGERIFAIPPEQLWPKMRDAAFLATCIPDVEKVTEQEPDRAVFTVRPGLAFARGTLEVTLRVVEKTPPTSPDDRRIAL